MSIVLNKPGTAKMTAKAGKQIGQAEAAKQSHQEAMALLAEQRAMQWEIEKAEMRSRQEFEKELRDKQFAYDAEERARQWQIEKMELASRLDFEQDEKKRLKSQAEWQAGLDTINKNKYNMGDVQYNRALFNLASIYAPRGVSEAGRYLGFNPKEDLLSQISATQPIEEDKVKTTKTLTQEDFIKAKAEGKTLVRNRNTGQIGKLETNKVAAEVAKGNVDIISEKKLFPKEEWNRRPMLYEVEQFAAQGKAFLKNKQTGKFEIMPIEEVKDAMKTGKYEAVSPTVLSDATSYRGSRGSFFF